MYKIEVKYLDDKHKFTEAADTFNKYGYYTSAPRGTKEYRRYWKEQLDRSVNGFVAVDGERISGYFYWYLNFCPIYVTTQTDYVDYRGHKRTKKHRELRFPDFYDYDRSYYDTIDEAELSGKHLVVIKKRGAGYSFKGASMLLRNYFCIPGSKSYAIASELEFLTKDGLLSKAWEMMDFIDQHTAFSKKRQKVNTKTHRRASIVKDIDGVQSEIGYKSEIMGISLKNDEQKARGKRGKLILWEEAGKFPNLKTAWQIARPSVEDDDGRAYGLMIAYGTGGSEDTDYEGLQDLFYEPDAYNALPIENSWDEGNSDRPCGFFVPQYYNMYGHDAEGRSFMDSNGNSNIKVAIEYSIKEREKVIANASDRNAIDRYIAERPFTPTEACLQISTNIFPKKDLITHLADIRNSQAIKDFKQVGDLEWTKEGLLKWEPNEHLKDLTKYRLNVGESKQGAIVIWEHPDPDPPFGLYIIGVDPYDFDKSTTNSLGSCLVFKRFQKFEKFYDLIVAEYTGRPDTAEEFYENVRKLAKYYGASVLYENEKKGLFTYFEQKHCEYMLADQPGTIKDVIKDSKVQRGKGIHMNKQIKQWGEGLIKDFLNEEFAPGQKNLLKLYSEPLLEELINYNDTGNFDRCLIKGTNISTIDGYKKVENIAIGDKVLTHLGNFKEVSAVDKHIPNNKILKFKIIGNYEELIVTDNHPIYVAYIDKKKHLYRKEVLNNIKYLNASELKYKYQFVLQPKRKKLIKNDISDDLKYLLGWYVSDGYVNEKTNKIQITFQKDQIEIAKKIAKILDDNSIGESSNYNNRIYISKNSQVVDKGNYVNVYKTSKNISSFLIQNGGKSKDKKLSEEAYNWDNNLMLCVGYLEGDGHQKKYSKYDGYRREIIEASGIYEILIKQIRQILIDNGVWSSIRQINPKNINNKIQYSISISRGYINKIASRSLNFFTVNNINLVEKNVQYETEDGFWTPIKLISEIKYNDFVYNFEVKDDHTYVASNIVTHNCMAFMMVMIYREELFNITVKKKVEFNRERMLFPEPLFIHNLIDI